MVNDTSDTNGVCVVCSTKKDNNGKNIRPEGCFQCLECGVGLCVDPCL